MSRTCEKCGKGPKKAVTRSHSKIRTLRTQKANLQKINGKKLCTACIRTMVKKTA
ncbi:MAG: 50S ribosomal protein L28 [Candidatus Magasanikbacteria bacterium]|nr:50S ribosomal protein L28 [Candidatus Magasanikbacteria bacterium]